MHGDAASVTGPGPPYTVPGGKGVIATLPPQPQANAPVRQGSCPIEFFAHFIESGHVTFEVWPLARMDRYTGTKALTTQQPNIAFMRGRRSGWIPVPAQEVRDDWYE